MFIEVTMQLDGQSVYSKTTLSNFLPLKNFKYVNIYLDFVAETCTYTVRVQNCFGGGDRERERVCLRYFD